MSFHALKAYARAHRGVVFNVVFLLYVLAIQPVLLAGFTGVVREDQVNRGIGIIVAVVLILETVALWYKIRVVQQRAAAPFEESKYFGTLFTVWVGHMIILSVLIVSMLEAFGVNVSDGEVPTWAGLIMFGIIVRDLIVFLIFPISAREPRAKRITAGQEFFADIILTIFACVAYTAGWETTSLPLHFSGYHGAELIVYIFVAALAFLILFIPTRFGFLYEEVLMAKEDRDLRAIIISLLLTTASVIGAMLLYS